MTGKRKRNAKEIREFEVFEFIQRLGGIESTLKELCEEDTPKQWVNRKRKYLTEIYNKYNHS